MALRRHIAGSHEERRATRTFVLAEGTLACPRCDAPVLPPGGRCGPADGLGCPYCFHEAPARDFLTLGEPTRPMRVNVLVRNVDRCSIRPDRSTPR